MNERVLQLRRDRGLLAILSSPASNRSSDFACVLVNAGVIHRIGPHRLNVKIARHLAERGIPALRLDLSGIGDSRPELTARPFADQAVLDIQTAIDHLQSMLGMRRFVVMGLCSGAAVGYRVALADRRVVGLQMLDPYAYLTRRASLRYYLERMRLLEAWSGAFNNLFNREAEQAPNALLQDFVTDPPAAEFATGLRTLLERGTAINCVYTGSLNKIFNYDWQFDEIMQPFGLSGRVRVDYLPDSTHTFLDLASQRQLIELTDEWIQQALLYPRRPGVLSVAPTPGPALAPAAGA